MYLALAGMPVILLADIATVCGCFALAFDVKVDVSQYDMDV